MWWRVKNALYRVTHPSFWLQNERTSYEWDETLRNLLDECPIKVDRYTAEIGGRTVWISNYPYAFGSLYGGMQLSGPLPSPLTRVRLRKEIDRLL